MEIIAKFTVASEQGIETLFHFKVAKFDEMYKSLVDAGQLEAFIKEQLNYRAAIDELNAFANQLIILYVDNEPAGFAIVNQTAFYPEALKGKRSLQYSYFYLLPQFDLPEAKAALWQKCLSVSKMQDAVWIELLRDDRLVPFFQDCGFVIHAESVMAPFDQPSYVLIRYKDNN